MAFFFKACATRMISLSHRVCQTHKYTKSCKGKIDEILMERYYKISMHKNSQVTGKKHAHGNSMMSLFESQLESAKVLVSSKNLFPLPIPAQKQSQMNSKWI